MKEIKNKRISVENIKYIAMLINERFKHLSNLNLQYEDETKVYSDIINKTPKNIVVHTHPYLDLSITIDNHTETKSDINWFINCLETQANLIENIKISYVAYYTKNATNNEFSKCERSEEEIFILMDIDSFRISYTFKNQDENFVILQNKIDNLLDKLPNNCDKVITNKSVREFIPSFSLSLTFCLIIGVVLYLYFKFNPIDIFNFDLSICFIPASLLICFLLSCIVSGKNHSLYRKLNLKTKYAGYSLEKGKSLYEEDVNNYLEHSEVEIGQNAKNGVLRQKIESNYQKAKTAVAIKLLVYILAFVITLIV